MVLGACLHCQANKTKEEQGCITTFLLGLVAPLVGIQVVSMNMDSGYLLTGSCSYASPQKFPQQLFPHK
jgi:hypothetical protein